MPTTLKLSETQHVPEQQNTVTSEMNRKRLGATKIYLYLLERKLSKLYGNNLSYTEQNSRCIVNCFEGLAPKTETKIKEDPKNRVPNTKKQAIANRD